MKLTLELVSGEPLSSSEVALCFDEESLELLIEHLVRLRGRRDHEHLMTPSWAGMDLTEEKAGDDSWLLLHHLRLVKF